MENCCIRGFLFFSYSLRRARQTKYSPPQTLRRSACNRNVTVLSSTTCTCTYASIRSFSSFRGPKNFPFRIGVHLLRFALTQQSSQPAYGATGQRPQLLPRSTHSKLLPLQTETPSLATTHLGILPYPITIATSEQTLALDTLQKTVSSSKSLPSVTWLHRFCNSLRAPPSLRTYPRLPNSTRRSRRFTRATEQSATN